MSKGKYIIKLLSKFDNQSVEKILKHLNSQNNINWYNFKVGDIYYLSSEFDCNFDLKVVSIDNTTKEVLLTIQ